MTQPTGYSVDAYGDMIASEPRISAYVAALRKALVPGARVIDLGAGFGIFSLLACRYGAGSVVAIEPDPSIQLLHRLASDNGCADRIQIVPDVSTRFEPETKADVIVSDCRGALPLYEQHVATIKDARDRLLAKGGCLIPQKDLLRAALISNAEPYRLCEEPWRRNDLGIDLLAGRRFAINRMTKVKLDASDLASDAATLAELDYRTITEPNLASGVELVAAKPATVHGFALWFDAELLDGIGYSNAPGEPPLVYGQTFFPFEEPFEVGEGDVVRIRIRADLVDGSYEWSWKSRHHPVGGEPSREFEQSTFLSRSFSPEFLARKRSDYAPPRPAGVDVDAFLLGLLDGRRTLHDLAEALQTRFPQRFASAKSALDEATRLAARYRD